MLRKLFLLMSLLVLTACGKQTFDPASVAACYENGSMSAQYTVTTHSDFYTEYQLAATEEDGVQTVTILRPESVAGITAVLQGDQATLQYEEVSLDALLPQIAGCAPADVLYGLLENLKKDVPTGFAQENDTVILDYQEILSDGTDLLKQMVLHRETLALQSAEIYLDGDLLLTLRVDSFQWTPVG